VACVLHARHHGIFADRIRNVGKQTRDESGKYPVNENDEEISCARNSLPHLYVHSGAALPEMSREAAIVVPSSLRAKRLVRRSFSEGGSNPCRCITDGWIAS
jgi:hypothetical protein